MKRIFYFVMLTVLFIPFAINAETNYDEIYNSISKDGKIIINSVPLEYYKETKYYNTCIERVSEMSQSEKEKTCIETIYHDIVSAQIKRTVKVPKDIWVYASSCDIENNTCDIVVEDNYKKYNIEFIENKNEKIFKNAEKTFSSMKGSYSLSDMGYINQLINYSDISGFFNELQNSSEVFNIYPEMKKDLEKNRNIEYVSVFGGGGGSPTNYGAGGTVIAFDNGVAIGITEIGYTTYRTVYIPDTTKETTDEYIKAALARINKYINNEDYKVEIVYAEEATNNFCNTEWEECVLKNVFKKDDEYSFDIYKIIINGKENYLGIVPVDEKNIKKLEIKSTNHKTGINVETNSSDVPLDSIVVAEDTTENHKKDGFMKAYDINLFSNIKDEYINKIKDGIIVRIPMEDDFDKDFATVYHIKDDGTKGDKYNAKIEKIDGKKYAVFTTNHFSTYAIEEVKNEKIENPNTSDNVINDIVVLLLSVFSLSGLGIYLRKKENN